MPLSDRGLMFSLLLLFPLFLIDLSFQSAQEYRLIQDLKEDYDTIERPVRNHVESLPVKLRVLLQQIVDVDERNQALTLVIWTEISWSDYKLKWEPKEYGNVTTIELPHKNLWRPDILLFNSAIDKFDASYPVNSIVSYTGDVFIAPPGIVKVSCQLEMTWFPFDEQICYLKYGSWTYAGSQVNLSIDDADLDKKFLMDMKYYVPSEEFAVVGKLYFMRNCQGPGYLVPKRMAPEEWTAKGGYRFVTNFQTFGPLKGFPHAIKSLPAAPANKTVKEFEGETYIELYFHLHLRRKSFYYVMNWVIPAVLISMCNIIQFMMPTGGGEKITLRRVLCPLLYFHLIIETTNVLATLVFLTQTAKSTPPTSDSIPVLSQFFSASLCLMGASTVATVLIMNVHFRSANLVKMSPLSRKIFLEILPKFVFLPPQPEFESSDGTEKVEKEEIELYKVARIKEMAAALSPRLSLTFDDYLIYSRMEKDVNEIIEILKEFEDKLKTDQQDRRTEEDFRFMAKVLDRICMGLYGSMFLVVTLVLLTFAIIKN